MKKSIKFLSVAMGLTSAFLCACGGGGGTESSNGGGSGGDKIYADRQLFIEMRLSGYGEWLNDYAVEFEEETGCDVTVVWNPTLNEEVRNIFISDNYVLSDLYFAVNSDLWYNWTKDGKLEPIMDLDERMNKTVASYGVYEGERYVLSPLMPPLGFVYNKEYLAEIPSKGEYTQGQFPETWQGLLDLCDATNEMSNIGGRTDVKPMSWSGQKDSWEDIFKVLWAQGNGGDDWEAYLNQQGETPLESAFKNDSITKALEAIVKLINSDGDYSKNSIDGCGEKDHIQQQQNFLNGDCVFAPTGGWFETEMKDSITKDTFEYGFANYPQVDTTQERTAFINIPSEGFYIPAAAEEKEIAQAFLEFLFTEENCKRLHEDLGTPIAFDYDFTAEDVAKLSSFNQDITNCVMGNDIVLKGSNSIMFGTGACMGGLLSSNGSQVKIIDLLLKTEKSVALSKVSTYINDNYNGYQVKWNEKLEAAGLKK